MRACCSPDQEQAMQLMVAVKAWLFPAVYAFVQGKKKQQRK